MTTSPPPPRSPVRTHCLAAGACVGPPDPFERRHGQPVGQPDAVSDRVAQHCQLRDFRAECVRAAGTIDVSHSQTISATIGGIPAGNGYSLTITGTAIDGLTTCTGSATFSITPRRPPWS